MSIAKWLVPLSCTSRGEVAIARPKQTPRGRLPDSGSLSGGVLGSGLDPGPPPRGGSGSRLRDPYFPGKMRSGTGFCAGMRF